MDLPNLEDLGKVIDLCRKKGVESISIGAVTLKLGPEPEKRTRKKREVTEHDPANPYQDFPEGELTPTQLMFYSAGGMPGQEPWNQKEIPE